MRMDFGMHSSIGSTLLEGSHERLLLFGDHLKTHSDHFHVEDATRHKDFCFRLEHS